MKLSNPHKNILFKWFIWPSSSFTVNSAWADFYSQNSLRSSMFFLWVERCWFPLTWKAFCLFSTASPANSCRLAFLLVPTLDRVGSCITLAVLFTTASGVSSLLAVLSSASLLTGETLVESDFVVEWSWLDCDSFCLRRLAFRFSFHFSFLASNLHFSFSSSSFLGSAFPLPFLEASCKKETYSSSTSSIIWLDYFQHCSQANRDALAASAVSQAI